MCCVSRSYFCSVQPVCILIKKYHSSQGGAQGRGNRVDFVGRLGAGGDSSRDDQMGGCGVREC